MGMAPPRCALTIRDAAGDEMRDRHGVLDRRADRPGQAVRVDERRFGAAAGRMDEQDGRPAVEFLIQRFEHGVGDRSPQDRRGDRQPDRSGQRQGPVDLIQGRPDMRQRQRGEDPEPGRESAGEVEVAIVDEAGGVHGVSGIFEGRDQRRDRQRLVVDAGGCHELHSGLDLARPIARPERVHT
jgi:hypothetical protein